MSDIGKSVDTPVALPLSFWRIVACLLPLSLCGGSRLAFAAETPVEAPAQIGNFLPRPSNTGKDWQPNGKAVYDLVASRRTAAFPVFGIDTEGSEPARTNLLREPIRIVFTIADGKLLDTTSLAATAAFAPSRVSPPIRQ